MTRNRGPKIDLSPPALEAWRIEKKQVVCAELAAAIRLFFNGDYIAAHVLTGAALDILRGVAQSKGIATTWEGSKDVIVEEHQDLFFQMMNEDYNFFKHAMTDAGKFRHRYQPEMTAMSLLMACRDFMNIYPDQKYFEPMMFIAWVCLWKPRLVLEGRAGFFDHFKSELQVIPDDDLWSATEGARRSLKFHDENLRQMETVAPNLLREGRELHLKTV